MGFTVTPITLPTFDLTVTNPLQVTLRGTYVLQKRSSPLIAPEVRPPPTTNTNDSTEWVLSARYWIYSRPDYTNIEPIFQHTVSVNCPEVPADPFVTLYAALKALYPGTHVDN